MSTLTTPLHFTLALNSVWGLLPRRVVPVRTLSYPQGHTYRAQSQTVILPNRNCLSIRKIRILLPTGRCVVFALRIPFALLVCSTPPFPPFFPFLDLARFYEG